MEGAMCSKNASLSLFVTLAGVLLAPNCVTLMEQKTQVIPVTSSPVGATVSVNGQQQGLTPLVIRLVKKTRDQVVRIEAAGYNPFEIRVHRRASAGKVVMDVVLGAASGFAAALLYAGITREPWVTTEPRGFDSETVLVIAIPALMIAFPLIDSASGKIYHLNPAELTVTLTKAEGSVRVDTILVDAAELRNVKWIRIRRN
jgi:PEGA domain